MLRETTDKVKKGILRSTSLLRVLYTRLVSNAEDSNLMKLLV
jgi:hypothetical protein